MSILVTGGCGFIGTNFIKRYMELFPEERVVNIDKLTYAGNRQNHSKLSADNRYVFLPIDINDSNTIRTLLRNHKPKAIIHFAAESHVDNSIKDSSPFIITNVLGTHNLLECARKYIDWDFKFIHVSTDEVYGSLNLNDPRFTEETAYDPRSPYSASKAASDHIASAYYHTHNLPVMITNCSNNYGPYQFPEKLVPVVINKVLNNEKVPVYGTGMNIRDWIYVTDHCDGIIKVLENGRLGQKYNIGGNCEVDNITLVNNILDIMGAEKNLIEYVEDRKGHDFRYAIDNTKMANELNWTPKTHLKDGLKQTIDWYLSNKDWLNVMKTRVKQ